MASQQMSRRENTTTEREIHIEKDKVPKMATHFEHLVEQEKDSAGTTPSHGSNDGIQSGEHRRGHAGKAIGDIGGPGEARETHELGIHFQCPMEEERKSDADSGRTANVAGNKDDRARKETERRGSGVDTSSVHAPSSVGKFYTEAEEERDSEENSRNRNGAGIETRTRYVPGLEGGKERGGRMDHRERAGEEKGRVRVSRAATEGLTAEQKERGSEREGRDQRTGRETQEEKGVRERYIAMEKASQGKDMAAQAKNATNEKGQKGYIPAKETISSASKTALDYTAPVAEKANDYTVKTREMAKSAGSTTASYIGEKAGQAKDVTVETGKSAAGKPGKVAADLKDKATVAGWAAAHYSVEKTVEGTKIAAHAAQEAAGYAGHKATEIAAKSLGAVKGLAAQAGETAVGYTAKKKEQAAHELEAKRASHQRVEEGKQSGNGQALGPHAPGFQNQQQHEGEEQGGVGQTLGQFAPKIKPSGTENQQRDQEHRQEREEFGIDQSEENYDQRGKLEGKGVLGAIGETLVEIAETAKNLVIGDDETKVKQKKGSERGNLHGYSEYDEYSH